MAILKDILRIKTLREDRAEKTFVGRRLEYSLARETLLRQEAELNRFREFRLTHERELYQDLCLRIVRLRDIQEVQYQSALMRQGERDREDSERQARSGLEQADKALHGAEQDWHNASRAREKFTNVVDDFDRGLRLAQERSEELELEESFRITEDRENLDAWCQGRDETD